MANIVRRWEVNFQAQRPSIDRSFYGAEGDAARFDRVSCHFAASQVAVITSTAFEVTL